MDIYEKTLDLIDLAYEKGDPDAVAVVDGGFREALADLMYGCYDEGEFCKWLVEHDLDVCVDFRFADVKTFDEIIEEVDAGDDEPSGTYNLDVDEWQTLTREEKIERIKEAADCLMVGDNALCVSW